MQMFRRGECVLAKCQNYPFWPGIIQAYSRDNDSYKVSFVGQNSYATISACFVVPFSQKAAKSILFENNNSSNKKLKRSIVLATRRCKSKFNAANCKSVNNSSFQEMEQLQMNEVPVNTRQKHSFSKAVKPEKEANFLLQKILNQIIQGSGQTNQTDQLRLQAAFDSSELELKTVIEEKIIQKLIMVVKAGDTFHTHQQIINYLKKKYQMIKQLLSAQYGELDLHPLKKQNAVMKLSLFKAYL